MYTDFITRLYWKEKEIIIKYKTVLCREDLSSKEDMWEGTTSLTRCPKKTRYPSSIARTIFPGNLRHCTFIIYFFIGCDDLSGKMGVD